jgi:molybdate transport system substrate-binding protein
MRTIFKGTGFAILLVIVLLAIVAGCANKPAGNGGGTAVKPTNDILIFVPCGQTGPYFEVKTLFEKANPGITITETPENISVIVRKILDGESPDVFMSMGDQEITSLEAKGRIVADTRTPYARNSLVLVVPKGNPAKVKELKDVANASVKSFITANPEVNSLGFHTRQALEKLGLWQQMIAKTQIPGEPQSVGEAIGKGDCQAGVAYLPCQMETHIPGSKPVPKKNVVMAQIIPQELYTPFYCEAAVVKGAANPEGGKKFIAFLKEPQCQAIFEKWSFSDPFKKAKAK